ncbi:hypothetical protein C0991_001810 [Blastosporella zonata]|nr:hypothetical protein C0991_001810 [Blastosporella zonata]
MPEHSTKKRKQTGNVVDIEKPAKKSKKDKRDKTDQKEKRDTEFHVVKTSLVVSIAPTFAANPRAGVEEMLDSMVMRYIPALRGVVLSHSNLRFLSKTATIQADSPYLVCSIEFDATVWSPQVGMKLMGKINLCSPDHISLLLHRTFNVSIPRHHIPKDEWEFEYGPAENDPEFGPEADAEDAEEGTSKKEGDGGGKWVHHVTGAKLGNTAGYLTFTVIGLTVANEMLSLLGSVQPDPFSPEHVPQNGPAGKASPTQSEEVEDEIDLEEEELESDDEDTFKTLGKLSDEAAAAEAAQRAAAEEVELAAKDKKRKREEKKEKKEKKTKLST